MSIKSRLVKYLFPEALARLGHRRIPANQGVVLMYHEVLPDTARIPAWTVVRESDFRWQIDYLAKHFDIVTLGEAQQRVSGATKAQRPFCVITFDDGYAGNLSTAVPILSDKGCPCTVYIATKAIADGTLYWYDQLISLLERAGDVQLKIGDIEVSIPGNGSAGQRWVAMQRALTLLKSRGSTERDIVVKDAIERYGPIKSELRMLSPKDVKSLSQAPGVEIGCHTHGHELLDKVTAEVIQESVLEANSLLESWTGQAPRQFAYPNGNYNIRAAKLIEELGFESAVTTVPQRWSSADSPYLIPRLGVGRFENKRQFAARVSGFL